MAHFISMTSIGVWRSAGALVRVRRLNCVSPKKARRLTMRVKRFRAGFSQHRDNGLVVEDGFVKGDKLRDNLTGFLVLYKDHISDRGIFDFRKLRRSLNSSQRMVGQVGNEQSTFGVFAQTRWRVEFCRGERAIDEPWLARNSAIGFHRVTVQ